MKKRFFAFASVLVFLFVLAVPAFAEVAPLADFYTTAAHPPRLVDEAEILEDYEEEELLGILDEISTRQQFDVVIFTVYSLDGETPRAYADDYYDYNGYGISEERDGALLLLSMEERDWYVSTRGFGITVITDAGLDYMSEKFLPYFSEGDYSGGFKVFATECDSYIDAAKNGSPIDVGNLPKEPYNFGGSLVISLIIGFIIAFIVAKNMKSKLKTIRKNDTAVDYVVPGSFNLTNQRDIFLYNNVTRTAIPKDTSSSGSGGSSTHTSSSGATHGGGGGKF